MLTNPRNDLTRRDDFHSQRKGLQLKNVIIPGRTRCMKTAGGNVSGGKRKVEEGPRRRQRASSHKEQTETQRYFLSPVGHLGGTRTLFKMSGITASMKKNQLEFRETRLSRRSTRGLSKKKESPRSKARRRRKMRFLSREGK